MSGIYYPDDLTVSNYVLIKEEPCEAAEDDTEFLPALQRKHDVLLEMDTVVKSTLTECVSVLKCDPREYHPFYLRVYKYLRKGKLEGWLSSGEENSLWRKYDELGKSQWERWRNEGEKNASEITEGENQESPYLTFIKTGKVIIKGTEVEKLPTDLSEKEVVSYVSKEVKKFKRKRNMEDFKLRQEFFDRVKHITYPGYVKIMNEQWRELLASREISNWRSERIKKLPARYDDDGTTTTTDYETPSKRKRLASEEKYFENCRRTARERRSNMTEEQRQLVKEKARERYARKVENMSSEEFQQYKEKYRLLRLQRKTELDMMTPEEREQERTKQFLKTHSWLATKDKEWLEMYRQKQREKSRQRRLRMTPEEKAIEREKHRNYIRSLTGDKRKKYMENVRKNVNKWMTKKKLENPDYGKEKKLLYQRCRTEVESEEKRQARLLRCRLNQARRRTRKQLEQEGVPESEILLRLQQVEEKVRNMEVKSVYRPRPGARKSHKMTVKPVGRPRPTDELVVDKPLDENNIVLDSIQAIQLITMEEFQQEVPTITFAPLESETCSVMISQQDNSSNPACFNIEEIQPVVASHHDESVISTFSMPQTGEISLIIVPSNAILVTTEPEELPPPVQTVPTPDHKQENASAPKSGLPPSKSSAMCDQCGKSFCNPFGVQLHKNTVHALDPSSLYCPKCHFPASSTSSLWNHFTTQHISEIEALPADLFPKKTPIMPKLPRDPDMPNKQLRSIPGEVSTCPHCEKSFTQKATLTDHIRRIHQGLKHICDICGKDQQSVTKLWRHKVDRHGLHDLAPPEHVPIMKCKYCDDLLMRGYEQHVDKKHPEHLEDFKSWYNPAQGTAPKSHQNGPVQCPHCPSVVHAKLLNRHIKNMHTDRPKFPCPECNFPFKREDHMKKHFKDKHSFADIERKLEASQLIKVTSSSKRFKATCLLCGIELGSRIVLKAHFVASHHQVFQACQVASLPLFSCPVCQEKFQKEKELQNHVERIHPDNIFPCVHCAAIKFSREDITSHEKTHEKETGKKHKLSPKQKQFVAQVLNNLVVKCDHCGRGKKLMTMRRHMKEIHGVKMEKSEQVFRCKTCSGEDTFPDFRQYVAHMHLQHGVKLAELLNLFEPSDNTEHEGTAEHDGANSIQGTGRKRRKVDKQNCLKVEREKRLVVNVERMSEDLVQYYMAREIVKIECAVESSSVCI